MNTNQPTTRYCTNTTAPRESVIIIGNRYANHIKREIELLPERIGADIQSGDFGGFMWHNLASPCEMLVKYFGDELRALGFDNLVLKINNIGRLARDFQVMVDNGDFNNKEYTETHINNVLRFNKMLQELVPVMFFIV